MSDAGLQFSRVRAGGETQWHVHRAGRFLGSIVERDGGFRATRLVEGELPANASTTATLRPGGWRSSCRTNRLSRLDRAGQAVGRATPRAAPTHP